MRLFPSVLRLASASPRRRELLTSIGVTSEVAPVAIDETPQAGESADDYVVRLARDRASHYGLTAPALCHNRAKSLAQGFPHEW